MQNWFKGSGMDVFTSFCRSSATKNKNCKNTDLKKRLLIIRLNKLLTSFKIVRLRIARLFPSCQASLSNIASSIGCFQFQHSNRYLIFSWVLKHGKIIQSLKTETFKTTSRNASETKAQHLVSPAHELLLPVYLRVSPTCSIEQEVLKTKKRIPPQNINETPQKTEVSCCDVQISTRCTKRGWFRSSAFQQLAAAARPSLSPYTASSDAPLDTLLRLPARPVTQGHQRGQSRTGVNTYSHLEVLPLRTATRYLKLSNQEKGGLSDLRGLIKVLHEPLWDYSTELPPFSEAQN